MSFELIGNFLNGIIVLKPNKIVDDRGFFLESFKSSEFEKFGIPVDFKQDNHSKSKKNVIRGMHFQWNLPQGKLLRVLRGEIQLVEVDIRKDSATLGIYWTEIINTENNFIVWIPAGFANGFCTLTDDTEVFYKCTEEWIAQGEGSINPYDNDLNIDWKVKSALLSDKDKNAQSFKEFIKKDIEF